MTVNAFSASPSLAGYLYQCRLALLETLNRLKNDPCVIVFIESLDDIHFESKGKSFELLQTKLHLNRSANLTDSSLDIWKSVRIWIDQLKSGFNNSDIKRYLITTSKAADGSALSFLKLENRNVTTAEQIFHNVSLTSKNKDLQKIFSDFKALDKNERLNLLDTIIVIDNAINHAGITKNLHSSLWGICDREKLNIFIEYLEGWWFSRILKDIKNPNSYIMIPGNEIDSKINELREGFKQDNLPIDSELINAIVDHEIYKNYIFVKQLQLANINTNRIPFAVNNYYRAIEQRSRWIREDLLLVGDIEKYENKLIEEWDILFKATFDELEDSTSNEEKIKLAKKLYRWAEQEANIPIRVNCHEAFITRGSLQILSDNKKVGWHPDYRSLLDSLI